GQVESVLSNVGASVGTGGTGGTGGAGSGGAAASGSSSGSAGEGEPPDLAGGSGTEILLDASRPELLVVKTGELELQVASVEASVADGARTVSRFGGYVSGSEQSGAGSDMSATVTYRIPAAAWDAAVAGLRSSAQAIVAEKTTTEDVTGQVVDLRARIVNLQATEAALQAIMARATKIPEVLEVQGELTDIRGEIERATADRVHLEAQAAFSTLTVRYALKPEPAAVVARKGFDPQGEVDRASGRLVHILERLAAAGIWFGIVWLPFLVALTVIGAVIVVPLRRRGLLTRGATPGSAT
ncbi:MAG: DUF4349 domain-containing protein, partial [Candidatus Limnocylindrales bacterium]